MFLSQLGPKFSYGLRATILLLTVLSFAPSRAWAACHVVTPSGTGTHSGADWNNAYAGIPSTLTRGDTYFLADGTYPAYTFNTAVSGTTTVTIKKAIASDHCTDTGWNAASMGSSQAVIKTQLNITSGYLVVNGQTRSSISTGYGIKLDGSAADPAWMINFNGGSNNVVTYVEAVGRGSGGAQDNQDELLRCMNGTNNTVSYSYIHDSNNNLATINTCSGLVLDNDYFLRSYSTPQYHGQALETGGTTNSVVVSNSVWQDPIGTGFIAGLNSSTNNSWKVYNNIFYYSSGNPYGANVSPLLVGCADSAQCSNWAFVNNTIVNISNPGGSTQAVGITGTATGSGWVIENNLWYLPTQAIALGGTGGGGVEDYNSCIGSGCAANWSGQGSHDVVDSSGSTPFVNWQSGNFHLAVSTAAVSNGVSLASPYNVDPDGVVRTAGSVARGAYAFSGGGSSSSPPNPPTMLTTKINTP